ncbi:tRNA threonylcarbamoyladenosine biosynthesis protein TsaB [Ereboglobus sp. PH5-5]|uniref:peptidase M22 n=1 Tax=Ereboglobus sp. PH5-5 TaxID=2940529 RepID=UPI002405683B|nr:peptidase M22 [Ereboglobus sp. PH5-5]MDF9832957.1 tRNA threonylcarbamoyladenosine biosynthesis protein TsaB [Ereboglobus sp. PH5-5]
MSTTLSQITQTGPALLIDSASARVQLALLRADNDALWETQTGEAGTAIFSCAEKLLARASLKLDGVAAFVFCDGPGSVLGIRTAAVALRAWRVLRERPVYSYCSLALAARFLAKTENARNLSLIADARRDTWHHVGIDAGGRVSALRRVPTSELDGALAMPEHFRNWTPLPPDVRVTPYALETMLSALAGEPLFAPAPEPDAFLHEEPVYQTWTPRIHQAG